MGHTWWQSDDITHTGILVKVRSECDMNADITSDHLYYILSVILIWVKEIEVLYMWAKINILLNMCMNSMCSIAHTIDLKLSRKTVI